MPAGPLYIPGIPSMQMRDYIDGIRNWNGILGVFDYTAELTDDDVASRGDVHLPVICEWCAGSYWRELPGRTADHR